MKDLNTPGKYQVLLTSFGNFVKQLRQRRGDKIETVARALEVKHPVISRIENGKYTSLSFGMVTKLLDYYDVPVESMLTYLQEQLPQAGSGGDTMSSIINDVDKLSQRIRQATGL